MTGAPRLATGRASGLEAAAVSEQGPVRPRNEDRFVLDVQRGVLAVIDGMGGEGGGELAATLAAEAVRDAPDPERAFEVAHDAIRRRAATAPELARMGAVGTLALVGPGRAVVIHVGDTRAWRVGDGGPARLTDDHVVLAEDGRGGVRPAIARDLGAGPLLDGRIGDVTEVPLSPGDLLVLASDGVYGPIPPADWDARLARARRDRTPVDRLARGLVARALALGSTDNATVLVARFTGRGLGAELRRWWSGPVGS